jgi:hypothetical protein
MNDAVMQFAAFLLASTGEESENVVAFFLREAIKQVVAEEIAAGILQAGATPAQ